MDGTQPPQTSKTEGESAPGLFDAVGVEIEYTIVDRDSLDVRHVADRVLAAANAGVITSEVEVGPLLWRRELAAHLLELRATRPAARLDDDLLAAFEDGVRHADALLAEHGARLLPGAMHPWMDPLVDTVLWAHDGAPTFAALDRLFDCRAHGWSNIQSLRLDLPFAGDEEFFALHSAVRLVLPLLPALAASSPVVEGRLGGWLDHRLEHYRRKTAAVPEIAGYVIPEPVRSEAAYRRVILDPMFRRVAADDPDGLLRPESLNDRGAVARFDRGSIEIRLIDTQECPRADLAVAAAVTGVVRGLVEDLRSGAAPAGAETFATRPMDQILRQTSRFGAAAEIRDSAYLGALGLASSSMTAGAVWRHLVDRAASRGAIDEPWTSTLDEMLRLGPLAARLRRLLGPEPTRATLRDVYRRLADGLHAGELLRA